MIVTLSHLFLHSSNILNLTKAICYDPATLHEGSQRLSTSMNGISYPVHYRDTLYMPTYCGNCRTPEGNAEQVRLLRNIIKIITIGVVSNA